MNAVSASHDTHLLKIDNKVDKKMLSFLTLLCSFLGLLL